MKNYYTLSCLILISIQTTTHSLPNPINKILLKKIESIRRQMPCGINGGPSLVPFREEFVDVSHNNITNIRWVCCVCSIQLIKMKTLVHNSFNCRIVGFLQDLSIDNLDGFVANKIDFNLLRLKLDFEFTLPHTLIQGQYNITGQYLGRIKIWGSGAFSVELNGIV